MTRHYASVPLFYRAMGIDITNRRFRHGPLLRLCDRVVAIRNGTFVPPVYAEVETAWCNTGLPGCTRDKLFAGCPGASAGGDPNAIQ